MAVAIAIDATVVRCLLVPAVMTLLGKASWSDAELARPEAAADRVEGEEYCAKAPDAARGGEGLTPQPSSAAAARTATRSALTEGRSASAVRVAMKIVRWSEPSEISLTATPG